MSSISVSELPAEVLERVLLSLPPTDILKMKEVSHLFLDLISSSHHLQHRIDLFSAGLVDNSRIVCTLAKRRSLLREYVDGWKNAETPVQYDFTLKNRVRALNPFPASQNLFSAYSEDWTAISFIRVLSSPGQETVKEWMVELPFPIASHVTWSEENLLAAVEQGIRFINIHLLSLLDGSPHEIPLKSVLTLDLGHNHNPAVIEMRISGSRIALVIQVSSFPLGGRHKELIAWDWKTGEVVSDFTSWEIRFTTLIQVLKHLSDNPDMGDAIETIATMCFLEDSWLLVLSRGSPVARLLVFNTLLSQQDSRGWRILDLPLPGLQGYYFISTQYEKPLAEFPEFSVDPAQRFFVVFCMHKVALVTPVELLVRYVYSVRTSPCIPWTEWGEDVITVNLHPGTSQLRVFDTKVLALRTSCVEMFDLSASCRRDVQAQQVGERAGGRCERVLSTPKWSFRYPLGDGISYTTRLVGDSVVCFFERSSPPVGIYRLRIYKLGRT